MLKVLLWLGVVLVIAAILFAGAMYWLIWQVDRETVRPIEVSNSSGTAGTSLIVMSPGASSFPDDIAASFAQGLVNRGWRVELTTPSSQTTKDIAGYDLIVVGSHRPAMATYLLGSNASTIVRHAPCSVLVVRENHAGEG